MKQELIKQVIFEQYDSDDYLIIEKLKITDNLQKFNVFDIQPIFSDGVRGHAFTLRSEDISKFVEMLLELRKE
jgi:hypothetical protein